MNTSHHLLPASLTPNLAGVAADLAIVTRHLHEQAVADALAAIQERPAELTMHQLADAANWHAAGLLSLLPTAAEGGAQ